MGEWYETLAANGFNVVNHGIPIWKVGTEVQY